MENQVFLTKIKIKQPSPHLHGAQVPPMTAVLCFKQSCHSLCVAPSFTHLSSPSGYQIPSFSCSCPWGPSLQATPEKAQGAVQTQHYGLGVRSFWLYSSLWGPAWTTQVASFLCISISSPSAGTNNNSSTKQACCENQLVFVKPFEKCKAQSVCENYWYDSLPGIHTLFIQLPVYY